MKRFPFVRQADSMQCGAASLCMVSRHYGLRTDAAEMARLCGATNEGVSMLGLSDTAESLGFETACGRATTEALCEATLPCILHWNQNHYVVLHRISRKGARFHIADPAKGKVAMGRGEFESHWLSTGAQGERKGIVMLLEPGEGFGEGRDPGAEKACRERRSFRFLMGYLRRYRAQFVKIGLGLFIGCALQLVLPFLTQSIVDTGIARRDIGFIWLVLLGELMIVAGRTAIDFVRRWLLLHISMRVNISLVSDFFLKLMGLPMSFFDTKLLGDLLQRIGDHSRVQNFLTGQVLGLVFTLLSFVIFGAVLLVYSPVVFGIFLAGSVLYGGWIALFLRRRRILDYELFEQQAINQNRTYQLVTAMQEIKLQDCERRRRREWEETQAELFGVQLRSLKLQQTQEAGSIFINEVKNILITVFAATAVISGELTLGAMLAIQYIVGQLNSPVEQLMQFVYSLQDVKISLERINEVHRGDDEEDLCGGAESYAGPRGISLDNVSFRYDPHALKDTLGGITLDIPEGRVTAIVGASGSGKTTLVKLMLGYYRAREGSIRVAGRDIAGYSPRWWRRRCGVVMQEGVIFSESIERNIAVGDGDVDRERVERAARVANIHDYVMTLPLRYDTKVGRDGTGLSQGQKQRLLIARAVYRDPDFLFLDEATNALDARNEREIVESLGEFFRGRTVVVVAHRLSTVRNADNIIVLDRGRVAESGTHDELVARRGAYYTLVRNQLELGS